MYSEIGEQNRKNKCAKYSDVDMTGFIKQNDHTKKIELVCKIGATNKILVKKQYQYSPPLAKKWFHTLAMNCTWKFRLPHYVRKGDSISKQC